MNKKSEGNASDFLFNTKTGFLTFFVKQYVYYSKTTSLRRNHILNRVTK